MSTLRMATGRDFDSMNDKAAYSRLQDLVGLANGSYALDAWSQGHDMSPVQTFMAINSRAYFIMEVW